MRPWSILSQAGIRRILALAALLSAWFTYRYRCMCHLALAAYKHSLVSEEGKRAASDALAKLWERAEAKIAALPESCCFPPEIDMVCTGGGFKNCYSCGVAIALKILHQRRSQGKVRRLAGASAGSQVAFLVLKGDFELGLRWCFAVAKTFTDFPYVRPEPLWTYFYTKEAYATPLPAPGALRISISRLVWSNTIPTFTNEIVDSFEDVQQLADALLATASIPFLTCPGLLRRYNFPQYNLSQYNLKTGSSAPPSASKAPAAGWNWVIDGGVTDNAPLFTDGQRPQVCTHSFLSSVIHCSIPTLVANSRGTNSLADTHSLLSQYSNSSWSAMRTCLRSTRRYSIFQQRRCLN
jgi:predicted acylesterase/phospholipase RssA